MLLNVKSMNLQNDALVSLRENNFNNKSTLSYIRSKEY
jgi:hypothetical protein